MRALSEVPFKEDHSKKSKIDWAIAFPKVTFMYREKKGDKNEIFLGEFDYKCLMEKFGLTIENNELNNVKTLMNTISSYFDRNKVTIEVFQLKYYALEFKGEEDKTLFKVYLKNDEN